MENKHVGLPTLCLLPLRNAEFTVVEEIKITIPRKGKYSELSSELFKDEDGEFNLLDEDVFYLPAITKVLLATGNYPNLKGNQLFTPAVVIFNDDSVEIQGSVLEIIKIIQ